MWEKEANPNRWNQTIIQPFKKRRLYKMRELQAYYVYVTYKIIAILIEERLYQILEDIAEECQAES